MYASYHYYLEIMVSFSYCFWIAQYHICIYVIYVYNELPNQHLCQTIYAHYLLTCLRIICNVEHLKWSILLPVWENYTWVTCMHDLMQCVLLLCVCRYACNIICWLRGKLLHPNQAKSLCSDFRLLDDTKKYLQIKN